MLSRRIDWPALNAWLKTRCDRYGYPLETRVIILRRSRTATVILRDPRTGEERYEQLTDLLLERMSLARAA